jgi:hypothetical protein
MSALEFSFELLVADELAHAPEKPLTRSKPKKRKRATTLPPEPLKRLRRKAADRQAQVG